ncbi:general stress protein A [Salinimicrobium marinum]|uniref:General stress protein A n=1 Tax=Salinimicrobium marinum TaxID=680283 RepID=A0A918W1C5_9FLAO|nr:glycosyltransferase family 8 protein [Salinimicrobium marinum]GHA48886.1 general stress protein A [Salinimicrobium marinum]
MVIVYCSDEHFVQHLLVSVVSLVHHQKNPEGLKIYVINGGLSSSSKELLAQFGKEHQLFLEVIEINESLYTDFMISQHASLANYYRISIPDALPSEVTRVLYLDCDILINGDLLPLWSTELTDNAIAAVPEFDNKRNIEMGLGNTRTFNSGVMLMNLEKWRKEGISAKVLDFISSNPDKIRFWDQDALNAVLLKDWIELPVRWNLMVDFIYRKKEIQDTEVLADIDNPAIIHFNQTFKPWHYQLRHPHKHLYRKFIKETPFRNYSPQDRSLTNIIRKTAALFLIVLRLKKH